MNTVAYFEIQVSDIEKGKKFYERVFGWSIIRDSNIPIEYYRIGNAGPLGGMLRRSRENVSPLGGINAFVNSIQVDHYDDTARNIVANGGKEIVPKFAVVGKCWQGYFMDPECNTFGIFEVDNEAK